MAFDLSNLHFPFCVGESYLLGKIEILFLKKIHNYGFRFYLFRIAVARDGFPCNGKFIGLSSLKFILVIFRCCGNLIIIF